MRLQRPPVALDHTLWEEPDSQLAACARASTGGTLRQQYKNGSPISNPTFTPQLGATTKGVIRELIAGTSTTPNKPNTKHLQIAQKSVADDNLALV